MSETLDFDPDALREKYRQERDRRLRPEANDQYIEITTDFRHYIDDPHVDPGFTRKPLTDAVEAVRLAAVARELKPHRTFEKRREAKPVKQPAPKPMTVERPRVMQRRIP